MKINCADRLTVLVITAAGGYREIVKHLLEKGANVDTQGVCGENTLMVTIDRYELDTARDIIEKGADVNAADTRGRTALSIALEQNDYQKAVTMLRAAGARQGTAA